MEALSVDEATEMLERSYYENQNEMLEGKRKDGEDGDDDGNEERLLHESMLNHSILV